MLSDAIVALATPPGRSALAVIRLSGQGVLQIAARIIPGFRADTERIATLANFVATDGEPIDRGVYTVFHGPRSYTGEDMVELSCHGGLQVPTRLLAALQRLGARPASPGEFTRRAVLNGKLDLIQAEAVGDLIDATAPAQVRAAIRQLEGGLSRRIAALRESLIEIQALLSYNIDFPEEDDGPVSPGRIADRVDTVADQIRHMVTTAPAVERLREGALVVFAGRPNAGKSSLFNALLGTERALVTAIPGTTRDTVEADTDFLGWPVRLADTAGLWDAPSEIDRLGMEVSRRYLSAADLVLLCVESGRTPEADECAIMDQDRTLLVRTKSDLARAEGDGVPVSAMTGEGLGELRRAAAERVFGEAIRLVDLEPALSRERHLAALVRARNGLEQVIPQLGPQGDAVLASHHVREATSALDELLGVVDIEEVLDRVFANFCVGK